MAVAVMSVRVPMSMAVSMAMRVPVVTGSPCWCSCRNARFRLQLLHPSFME